MNTSNANANTSANTNANANTKGSPSAKPPQTYVVELMATVIVRAVGGKGEGEGNPERMLVGETRAWFPVCADWDADKANDVLSGCKALYPIASLAIELARNLDKPTYLG